MSGDIPRSPAEMDGPPKLSLSLSRSLDESEAGEAVSKKQKLC